jgi:hypothetical protein
MARSILFYYGYGIYLYSIHRTFVYLLLMIIASAYLMRTYVFVY